MNPELKLEDCVTYVKDRAHNDERYSVDCSKIHNLGWNETTNLEDGLKDTIKWYLDNPHHWN